ncbi:protein of unknown function [Tepidibacter aestuarii]|nr:protein of unknown function [Tepidibacter aestuarii]
MNNVDQRIKFAIILSNGARRTRWRHELCDSIKQILIQN